MGDLELIKEYLRIDYDNDDDMLVHFIELANLFLSGAITNWALIKEKKEYRDKVKLLLAVAVQDLYDNRGIKTVELKENRIIQSLIIQLDLLGVTL